WTPVSESDSSGRLCAALGKHQPVSSGRPQKDQHHLLPAVALSSGGFARSRPKPVPAPSDFLRRAAARLGRHNRPVDRHCGSARILRFPLAEAGNQLRNGIAFEARLDGCTIGRRLAPPARGRASLDPQEGTGARWGAPTMPEWSGSKTTRILRARDESSVVIYAVCPSLQQQPGALHTTDGKLTKGQLRE